MEELPVSAALEGSGATSPYSAAHSRRRSSLALTNLASNAALTEGAAEQGARAHTSNRSLEWTDE